MSTLTFTEKMFSRAAGGIDAHAGDFVSPNPEFVIVHDSYLPAVYRELTGLGYKRISNPRRLIAVTDHEVLFASPQSALRDQFNRKVMREWRGGRHFLAGEGHGHIVPMEQGLVRPGSFIIAYDMHASNFGAIGAYAMTVGTDISVVLATGTRMSRVPETILARLTGGLRNGVHTRDLGYAMSHGFTAGIYGCSVEGAVVEFQGEGIANLSIGDRIGLANTLTEISAAHILFPPVNYDGTPNTEYSNLPSGPDAQFLATLDIDLDSVTPQVALPGAPENSTDIETVIGTPVQHAFIGACGSSHYDDLKAGAEFLRGRHIADGVRMFITPGTAGIAKQLMRDGIAQIYLDAGAIILPSGCGPCAGGAMAPVGDGEASISTAATNSPGRMGSPEADYYLGSPLTVAASAIAGRITDPRDFQRAAA